MLTTGLLYAYYHIIKERFSGKMRRVALNNLTGEIVFIGQGKAKPVKTRPNMNLHRADAVYKKCGN